MKWLLAAILAAAPLAVQAEVADKSAAGFETRHIANLAAPQAKVRAAIFEVAKWWSSDHTFSGDAKNLSMADGCFCEKLPDGFVRHMTIVYSDDGALRLAGGLGPLQTTGAFGHLIFRFEKAAEPDKTLLTVTFAAGGYAKGGLAETWAGPVDFVLGEQVGRLKKYVETGKAE